MKLSKRTWSVYLTATLIILPVLAMLAACRSSTKPTATAIVTLTQTHTLAVSTALTTPIPEISTATTAQVSTPTPCPENKCATDTPSPSITPSATSSLGAEQDSLQGITLQFWYVAQAGDAVGILPALVSDFNKTNTWGVRVEISAFDSPGQLSEQVRNNLYSGKLPDLLAGYSYQGTSWDKNAQTLVDLNAYLQDTVWGLSEDEQSDFYASIWAQPKPGKRLGIPVHRTVLGIYYNATWAKELGYTTPPGTAQEFERQACAAAKANGDGTGGWMITSDASTLAGWMYAFGGALVRPDNQGYQIDTPENLAALSFLKELQTQGCAWTTPQLYPVSEFAGRKALFVLGDTNGIANQAAAIRSAGTGDQWTVIPFPAGADSSGSKGLPILIVYGPDLMISHTTPERQLAAWFFVRWMISPEVQARWARADGNFPVRKAALKMLADYAGGHPQWASLTQELDQLRGEPAFASWEIVRWVFADAANQLFSPIFTSQGIPDLLKMLETTANEANVQIR